MHIYLFIKQYIIRIYAYPHYVNSANIYHNHQNQPKLKANKRPTLTYKGSVQHSFGSLCCHQL